MDFVVVAKVAMIAIFPNVARVGVEERMVPPAIRELDTSEASLRHGGLGLKDWFHYDHRKKQSYKRENRLCVKGQCACKCLPFVSADFRTRRVQHF